MDNIKVSSFVFVCYVVLVAIDINECAGNLAGELPCDLTHSTCVNTLNSFTCECSAPWALDDDGLGCSRTFLVVKVALKVYTSGVLH